jgi:hypothetical protein
MFLMEPVMKVAPVRIKLTLDTTMSVAPETIAEGTPEALPKSEKVVRSEAVAILWTREAADALRLVVHPIAPEIITESVVWAVAARLEDHVSVAEIAAGSDVPTEALAAKLVTRETNFET